MVLMLCVKDVPEMEKLVLCCEAEGGQLKTALASCRSTRAVSSVSLCFLLNFQIYKLGSNESCQSQV